MAIFGKLATLERQTNCPELGKVYEFLKNTDLAAVFAKVSPGNNQTVEVDGDRIFAIFQQYAPKKAAEARLEGHRKYTDVQYIYEGAEKIGVCDLQDIVGDANYDAQKDIFFCDGQKMSLVRLSAGEAAILTPDDLHAPGIECGAKDVKKIVFKVLNAE